MPWNVRESIVAYVCVRIVYKCLNRRWHTHGRSWWMRSMWSGEIQMWCEQRTHTHTQPVRRCVRVTLKSNTNTGFVDTSAIWFAEASHSSLNAKSAIGVFIFHGGFQQNILVVIFNFILYSLFVLKMPFVACTRCKCLENANPFLVCVSVVRKSLSMTARRRCGQNEMYEERVRNIWNCLDSRCRRNSSSAKAKAKHTISNSVCTEKQRRLGFDSIYIFYSSYLF